MHQVSLTSTLWVHSRSPIATNKRLEDFFCLLSVPLLLLHIPHTLHFWLKIWLWAWRIPAHLLTTSSKNGAKPHWYLKFCKKPAQFTSRFPTFHRSVREREYFLLVRMIAIKNWAEWILFLKFIFQLFWRVLGFLGVYGMFWMCGVYGGCGFYVSRWCESSGGVVGGQSLFLGIQSYRLLRSGIGLTGRSHIWDFFPACKIWRLPIQPSICSNSFPFWLRGFFFLLLCEMMLILS